MSDRLLQRIGQIIHSYHQRRGAGLEKTCQEVMDCFESAKEPDLLSSSNVFRLSEVGLESLPLQRDDRLLVSEGSRLELYDSEAVTAYHFPTLKDAKWKLCDDAFAFPDTLIIELLSRGAVVYLLRSV